MRRYEVEILVAASVGDLRNGINGALREGWVLQGHPFSFGEFMHQMVVREIILSE